METEYGEDVSGPDTDGDLEIEVTCRWEDQCYDYVYLTKRDLERMLELYEEEACPTQTP